ncbi:hypothetical protein TNCV_175551 [Trichonephila clavipes]|nr:hypothetical protein TNCV_175551 [Trichonephila clavipes]
MLEPQLLDIMIVQVRNEKVSNHGSIPITIDCNVVAFIAFEEGFHQPIKRTKQVLWDLNRALRRPVEFLNTHFDKPGLCKPQCLNGAVILLEEKWAFPKYCHIVGSAALSRMSTYTLEFMFPITGTNGRRPNHEK